MDVAKKLINAGANLDLVSQVYKIIVLLKLVCISKNKVAVV